MTIRRGSLSAVTGTLPSFIRFSIATINYHLFHILDRVLFSMNLFVFINHFLSFQKNKKSETWADLLYVLMTSLSLTIHG